MRHTAILLFISLILVSQANAVDRIELDDGISLIVTKPKSTYYILSLVNRNDHNVTLIENIQISLPYDVDPLAVRAVDNYNQSVIPDDMNLRSVTLTYNNTIPPLGYGKIFLDLDAPKPAPTTTPLPTPLPKGEVTPSPTPQPSPTPPALITPPTPTFTIEPPIETLVPTPLESPPPIAPFEAEEMDPALIIIALIFLIFIILIAGGFLILLKDSGGNS
jgi:hypothetical protein